MKHALKYLILLCLPALCLPALAAPIEFQQLSAEDGLSDAVINTLYKDASGYIWIGTGSKLDRFDGIHLKHYALPGTGWKEKRINVLTETTDNSLWMGNDDGLWRLNREKDRFEAIASDYIEGGVFSLLPDKDGTLYIGSGQGLHIYRNGKIDKVLCDSNSLSASNHITGLALGDDRRLWMTTQQGLFVLRLSDRKVTSYYHSNDDRHVHAYNAIARIGSTLFLGTQYHGIISFDIPTERFSPYLSVGCNVITALSSDENDMLYVGTDGNGVHFISVSQRKVVCSFQHEAEREGSLRSNSVYSLLVDKEGLLWIGLYQVGIDYAYYRKVSFTTYSVPSLFDSKNLPIRAISINGDEKLIGSRDGLFYVNEKQRRFKNLTSCLRSPMVLCCYAFEGKYYVGTYGGGMYILDPADLSMRDFKDDTSIPFGQGHVFCLASDDEGSLWIGTSDGLYRYKNGQCIACYTSANSKLPAGNIYCIFFDSTRKGWICTESGLCLWDPSSQNLIIDGFPKDFVHKQKVRAVFEDSLHDLYFLFDKGVPLVSDLSITNYHYFPLHPLEEKDCTFISEDSEEWMWIGTNNGLFRYDKKETFISYSYPDGLPCPTFLNCPPVKDEDGGMWFGNLNGLLYWNPKKTFKRKWSYPIVISDVLVNDSSARGNLKRIGERQYKMSLNETGRNITICVSDLRYSNPRATRFEYKMEGIDEEWRITEGKQIISYYNLTFGKHIFRIRHANDENDKEEVQLSVSVPVPQEVWYGLLGLIALLSANVLFWKKVMRSKRFAVQAAPLPEPEIPDSEEEKKKYSRFNMSQKECEQIIRTLNKVMFQEKPYTNVNLKMSDLAAAIGVSTHTLSYLFNQYLKQSYTDYVNDCRTQEFIRLANTAEYATSTIDALAEQCGFGSRSSLFRHFKRKLGISPTEYIRNLRDKQQNKPPHQPK